MPKFYLAIKVKVKKYCHLLKYPRSLKELFTNRLDTDFFVSPKYILSPKDSGVNQIRAGI